MVYIFFVIYANIFGYSVLFRLLFCDLMEKGGAVFVYMLHGSGWGGPG